MKQQCSQCVHVRPRSYLPAVGLLWREVVESAEDLAGAGGRTRNFGLLSQAEVAQVRVVALSKQHVGGLHVAVNEPPPVRLVERRCDLANDRDDAVGIEGTFASHQRLQILTSDEPHCDEKQTVVLTGMKDGHDVGVIELCRRPRLGHEPVTKTFVLRQFGSDHLQRNSAIETNLRRPVDDAHPPAPDDVLDAISRNDPTNQAILHGSVVSLAASARKRTRCRTRRVPRDRRRVAPRNHVRCGGRC